MIFSLVAIAFGCYLILFYLGKVTAGQEKQRAILLRQSMGTFILLGGIGAIIVGVSHMALIIHQWK